MPLASLDICKCWAGVLSLVPSHFSSTLPLSLSLSLRLSLTSGECRACAAPPRAGRRAPRRHLGSPLLERRAARLLPRGARRPGSSSAAAADLRPASSARGHNGGRRICAGPAAAAVGALREGPPTPASGARTGGLELRGGVHGTRPPRASWQRRPIPPPSTAAAPPSSLPPPSSLRPGARPPPPWQTSSSAVVLPGGGLQLPRHGDVGRRGEQGPPAGWIPAAAPPLPLLPPLPASSVCAAAFASEICRRATPVRRGSPRQRAAPPSRW